MTYLSPEQIADLRLRARNTAGILSGIVTWRCDEAGALGTACRTAPELLHRLCDLLDKHTAQIAALTQERDEVKRKARIGAVISDGRKLAYDRLNICSDHRDKFTERCIVCDGERRGRELYRDEHERCVQDTADARDHREE